MSICKFEIWTSLECIRTSSAEYKNQGSTFDKIYCLVMQRHFGKSADPSLVVEDVSSGSGEDLNMLDGHSKPQNVTLNSGGRLKATGDAIVDAMLEIAAASKMRAAAIMRNEERFAISKCIKVLDEMQGVDQSIYFFALDLFENPNARETFISLKSERRLTWLQCKFNTSPNAANG
ncbi:uncharacterized protein LOC132612983 [Lycium barbarum]|uniref:uncharacterized protein LOC132612983 n=1 Tax=Lycium barbarum TaxID=112863 RepID=UPI00293F7689|nr:uncharacterized protein LOC132612983 [Lycium barbarum]